MIRSFKELAVYQKAFEQAMRIFELTKRFPNEGGTALLDGSNPRFFKVRLYKHRGSLEEEALPRSFREQAHRC